MATDTSLQPTGKQPGFKENLQSVLKAAGHDVKRAAHNLKGKLFKPDFQAEEGAEQLENTENTAWWAITDLRDLRAAARHHPYLTIIIGLATFSLAKIAATAAAVAIFTTFAIIGNAFIIGTFLQKGENKDILIANLNEPVEGYKLSDAWQAVKDFFSSSDEANESVEAEERDAAIADDHADVDSGAESE